MMRKNPMPNPTATYRDGHAGFAHLGPRSDALVPGIPRDDTRDALTRAAHLSYHGDYCGAWDAAVRARELGADFAALALGLIARDAGDLGLAEDLLIAAASAGELRAELALSSLLLDLDRPDEAHAALRAFSVPYPDPETELALREIARRAGDELAVRRHTRRAQAAGWTRRPDEVEGHPQVSLQQLVAST